MSDEIKERKYWSTHTPGIRLNVDSPFCGVEAECLESTLLTQNLEFIYPFIATVVTRVGETLRVLVREDGTISLHRCTTCQVLRAKSARSECET